MSENKLRPRKISFGSNMFSLIPKLEHCDVFALCIRSRYLEAVNVDVWRKKRNLQRKKTKFTTKFLEKTLLVKGVS